MASGQESETLDLEGESLFVSSLLNSMGYSKLEVSIRQSKWEFLERKDNIFLKFDEVDEGCVTSGSASEGMTGGPYYGGELSDYDCIKILRNFRIVETHEEASSERAQCSRNTVLLKEIPDEEFPGYFKLLVVDADPNFLENIPLLKKQRYLPNTIIKKAREFQLDLAKALTSKNPLAKHHTSTSSVQHGPAVSFQVMEPRATLESLHSLVGDPVTERQDVFHRNITACDIDMVSCIKRNRWPDLAKVWIERCQSKKWPLQSTFQSITKSRHTYLAPVGHKGSPNINLQWRLSFNAVEKDLIKSFNKTQIQCYALLKFYLKDYIKEVAANVLSSYCTKTTVFWISESEGAENMTSNKLLVYFVKCLQFIRKCLLDGRMPVYFIGTGSAFPSDMNTEETDKVLSELEKAIQDPVTPLQKCKSFRYPMHVSDGNAENFPKLTIHSVLFAWLEMRCGILESVHFCGTKDMLWGAYVDESVEENIRRYKDLTNEAKGLIYCQPLVQLLQSCLGFLCFANVSSGDTMSKDDCIILREAEDLLLRSRDGDITMCPLRLATFYLKQNKAYEVLQTTDVIISKAKEIQDRHLFMENLYKRIYDQFSVVGKIDDLQVLKTFLNLITANFNQKLHNEEILYLRNSCQETMNFINSPVAAQRSLSFDVTFMLPEAAALPSVVRLELYFSRLFEVAAQCRGMKISPVVYTYFLRFLAFHMLENTYMCNETLNLFRDVVQNEQQFYQARGYNLLARCFAMTDQTQEAAKFLLLSLKIDTSWNNVAFGYLVMVYKTLCSELF